MTSVAFEKMHGIGNDFVLIDARKQDFNINTETIVAMANRHTGIGFDQLLLINHSEYKNCDAAYRFFNPDGSEAEQCGNGQRCISLYLHQLNPKQTKFCVSGLAGLIRSKIVNTNNVTVNMGRVQSSELMRLENQDCHYVTFGNPHLVTTADVIDTCKLEQLHQRFEPYFDQGINFELVQILNRSNIKLRVFERGTGETMACGSGASAAVYALFSSGQLDNKVKVILPGGDLMVEYNQQDKNIYLTGLAQPVFTGEIKL
jgi:diaminopimelate epimerase